MRRWIVWNVLFRLQERIKGHPTFSILREMKAADRMGAVELDRLQAEKLRDLLSYGWQNVPYLRARLEEAGLSPETVRSRHDLEKLPVMTKDDVRRNRDALRSRIATGLTSRATGGSTGNPLIFDLSKRRIASQVACRQRVSNWWGLSVGDPEIALWGSPIERDRHDWIRMTRDWLMASRLLSAFEMNEGVMSRYLDILEQGHWKQIFGYPSAVHMLCLHARKEGRNLRNAGIRAAFVTGEVLYPHQRELISDVLGCPVANGYGGRDSGFISHECPDGGMHVLADAMIVELIKPDGKPAGPGEAGEIVATDLYSHEAPFVRYATGDMAVASAARCSCGRAHPLIEHIEGRANDSVRAPDGRVINSLAVMYPVREVPGIEQFRIHQEQIDHFRMEIVRNKDYPPDAEARIRSAWNKLLRAELKVTFEYLPALAPDRSGKYRFVTSKVTQTTGESANRT